MCTWGARGAYASSPSGHEVFHVEPVTDVAVQVVEYGDCPIALPVKSIHFWFVWKSHTHSFDSGNNRRSRTSMADKVNFDSAIGAGDTFIAGALHGLLEEWGAHRTVSFAVALATAKVQQDGFGGLALKVQAAG